VFWSLLATAPAALAQEPQERPWEFGISLGYGERSNPLVDGDEIKLYADLDFAWFGKRWFFDNGDLGFALSNSAQSTINLVARINSDRLFFSRTNTQFISFGGLLVDTPVPIAGDDAPISNDELFVVEAPDRSFAIETGIELLTDGRWGFLQAAAFHDASGTHNGYEASLLYGYGIARGRFYFEPSLTISYGSRKFNDYYWGLRADEVPAGVLPYFAKDGVNIRFRLAANYSISERISLNAAFEVERLSAAIRNSPIVRDDEVVGFFAGVGYRF
jgi:outer membrane protein